MSKHPQPEKLNTSTRRISCNCSLSFLLLLMLTLLTSVAHASSDNSATPRIVGGVDASPTAYPWITALLRSNTTGAIKAQFCGGTLIGSRWVLTAAHCVNDLSSASEVEVAIGISDLRNISSSDRITVINIFVHPAYNAISSDNDIALLELAVPSSNTLLAVADNTLTNSIPVGGTISADQMTIIGWGDTNATTTPATPSSFPDLLQETNVPRFDFATCDTIYNNELTSNMICAGFVAGGKDTCQGDSGGPLLYFNPGDSTWYQTGVTSFGNGCAIANNPGVYARIANYISWINSTIFSISLRNQVQFGYHGIGRSTSTVLTLRNESGAAITVSAVNLSNPTNFSLLSENCSSAGSIANSSNCTITLQFQAATAGTQLATLTVDFGTGNPSLSPTISGIGLAAITATALDETPTRTWYSGGNANWLSTNITNSNGGTAMRSGSIGNSQNSAFLSYITGPTTLSFRWKAATEVNYDFLKFYVDGVFVDAISGNQDWQQKSINISSGEHRISWVYQKDGSVSVLPDTVWLDSVNTPFTGGGTAGGPGSTPPRGFGSGGGGGAINGLFLVLLMLASVARLVSRTTLFSPRKNPQYRTTDVPHSVSLTTPVIYKV